MIYEELLWPLSNLTLSLSFSRGLRREFVV
jgi:hypothetical protein